MPHQANARLQRLHDAISLETDPAWRGVPADWVTYAQPASGFPQRPGATQRQVSVALDADLVAYFRSQGRDWRARVNSALRSFIEQRRAGESD